MAYTRDDLIQAERHVAHGERFVRLQEKIIALKKDRGLSFDEASGWLSFFRSGLERHISERDRIAEALATRFP